MKEITLPKASQLTSLNPVTVVCTQKPDGSTNLATVSWWTYLSYKPNMIAYAMAKTSYSGDMVRNSKKIILTIPGAQIAEAVLGCGMTTGRDTDKAAKFGIELIPVEGSSIQIPAHSRVAIVCSMKEYHETGDHGLPKVVFHSLRHSSITYKLKLNGGDMKSVQGDSGHAQMKMVADVYSHIIDEDRRLNARRFEEAFYSGHKTEEDLDGLHVHTIEEAASRQPAQQESDQELLMRLLTKSPEMATLIKTLAKSL